MARLFRLCIPQVDLVSCYAIMYFYSMFTYPIWFNSFFSLHVCLFYSQCVAPTNGLGRVSDQGESADIVH